MNHQLVEAARAGDSAGADRLIEAIWPDAYRLARAITGDATGAEDVAQESCIVLYRSISSLRSVEAFRIWFYRIVVREAARHLKRRVNEPLVEAPSPAASDPASSIDLWRALAQLAPPLREVIVLRYFEELSSREIAAILRIPDSSVRFRLMIARRRLQPMIGEDFDLVHTAHEGNVHARSF